MRWGDNWSMCGICGWLNVNNGIDGNTIENMNNIAKYRGPDDEGYLAISNCGILNMYGEDSCMSLEYDMSIKKYDSIIRNDFLLMAHRRLSIIDLSPNGHQPMNDNGLFITYNGEIYNYVEIKNELIEKGYLFRTESDTEVILKAYYQWGEECVNHFNGMWGFAIWDQNNHKLFCSRDRLGAKPFYYYHNGEEFIFSSEIKQLCQNSHVNRVLNESVMVTQIMWKITDYSEETLIRDIMSLPGGYNIVIQLDDNNEHILDFKKYKYWDIDTSIKEKNAENTIFSYLEDAIHIRTRSDAPIGVLLSGGLDSSCIVAEISEYYKRQGLSANSIDTFTSCYNNFEEGNEQNFANIVNKYCGTNENFIFPDSNETLELFEKLVWHLEGDTSIQVLGSYMLLEEISKTGIKVLLNGQGSDETQFGYERYYAYYFKDLVKKGKLKEAFKEFKDAKDNSRLSFSMLMQYVIYFSFFNIRKKRNYNRMNKYVTKDVLYIFNNNNDINTYLKHSSMESLQYHELKSTQLTHILRMDDRLYMSQSLESRVPFIDYRYVENAVKIPEAHKIQKGYTKYLLRNHYKNKLPNEIIWRKNKMGWPSPKNRWAERFNKEKIYELFETAKTKKYFNIENLKKLYSNNPASFPVEQFLVVEFFVRKFDVDIPL